jgi:hypothetical protein
VARGRKIMRIGLPSGTRLPRSSLAEHAGADPAKNASVSPVKTNSGQRRTAADQNDAR